MSLALTRAAWLLPRNPSRDGTLTDVAFALNVVVVAVDNVVSVCVCVCVARLAKDRVRGSLFGLNHLPTDDDDDDVNSCSHS